MQYRIVQEFCHNLKDIDGFVDTVNELMETGWKPQGGVSVFHGEGVIIVAQAMIKEE